MGAKDKRVVDWDAENGKQWDTYQRLLAVNADLTNQTLKNIDELYALKEQFAQVNKTNQYLSVLEFYKNLLTAAAPTGAIEGSEHKIAPVIWKKEDRQLIVDSIMSVVKKMNVELEKP